MNKKTRSILIGIMLIVMCCVVLVSCNNDKVSYFDYTKKDMGLVGQLIYWMRSWIGNYGWTVVVFTVFLKLIMLPLDFWQRYSARKSAVKMQKMQPLLDGIDKRYGANTQRANEEKQKLYKKQGYSMLSSCLPMIISMAVFFIMFSGLRHYSTYSSVNMFRILSDQYYDTYYDKVLSLEESDEIRSTYMSVYNERYSEKLAELKKDNPDINEEKAEYEAKLAGKIGGTLAIADSEFGRTTNGEAIEAIKARYESDIRESWLWIHNVWQPDTWATVMPKYDDRYNSFKQQVNMTGYPDKDGGETTYNIIRGAILETGSYGKNGTWNGLMILPIVSVGLSFLSMWLSQFLENRNRKKAGVETSQNQQQAMTNKIMMIMMPLMMANFGFIYTGAFAIYMVVNYMTSIISTVALRVPVEKLVQKNLAKGDKKDKNSKASYMR